AGGPVEPCHHALRWGDRDLREVYLELCPYRGNAQDPIRRTDGREQLRARARVIAGDRRERGPVEARRLQALLRIGAARTEALLTPRAGVLPEALELCLPLSVEVRDREQRDVAVLGVEPRVGVRRGHGQPDGREGDSPRAHGVACHAS